MSKMKDYVVGRLGGAARWLKKDDSGQGAVEYIGVIVVAGVIVLAIIAVASGVGEEIADGISNIVSDIIAGLSG